ncbi:MAG: bifunctional sterol desaturase/short chain dehydrogenase [Cyanothece sp. SIO1E1]|nr:bifunctional sterol desaturase/short chain dehydrogenase [Cyanothece sp. SIO1E1]
MLKTELSLTHKVIAVTGASGSLGQALIQAFSAQGAKVVALTTAKHLELDPAVEIVSWRPGAELELGDRLKTVDILVINHGVNVYHDRSPAAIQKSLEVNALSAWSLMELFLSTIEPSDQESNKEVWVNTSEAEVNPALSPLYELSKRMLGDLVTLRRLDRICVIRKLILGPFKSQLNPVGVMSPQWVAGAIVALAKRDFKDVIVTINPLTYILFPLKEISKSLYFRIFTHSPCMH